MGTEHRGHVCPVCGDPSDTEFTPYCSWDCQAVALDPVAYNKVPVQTEEQQFEFYGVRVDCPICDGGKNIPDIGCSRCNGKGWYNVVLVRVKNSP